MILTAFGRDGLEGDLSGSLELYLAGKSKVAAGDLPGALRDLQQSIVIHDHFKTHELLALCFEKLGDLSHAIAEYRLALSLNDRSNKTAVCLARALIAAGNCGEASQVLDTVIARSPQYGPAARLRAQLQ
jgi:Tfp pilus assembly protein PilF